MNALFSRLLYTNCLPGQGVAPGGGFGIQAQSPGTPQALSTAATDTLLYIVPAKWAGNTAMAVEDYPRSLAHFSGAGWATAQGRYAGQEAVGGRSGNHVTDCVLTESQASYGLTRPAQLWGAPLWRDEPFPTNSCPPIEEFLGPGELTAEELARWVRSDERIAPVLKRLVTVLENPEGRRVRIKSANVDAVVRWIAVATLLLPFEDALNVSFRVYSHNPDYDKHRVLGVHPDTAPAVRVGAGGSAFVLDADAFEADQVDVSRSADLWVALLASDADPYDVLDAVGQASSLAAPGADETAALAVACLLCIDGAPLDEPSVRNWLEEVDADRLTEFGTEVAQRVLDATPSSELIILVDRLRSEAVIGLDPAEIRLRLLTAETADAAAGRAIHPDPLPDAGLGPGERQTAAVDWSTELALATTVPTFAQLLHVAWRHDLRPEIAPVGPHIYRFIEALLSVSSETLAQLDPTRWAFSRKILHTVKDQIVGRIETADEASAAALVEHWWRFLLHNDLDVPQPIDKAVVGLAMTQGSRSEKAQLVDRQLRSASLRTSAYAYVEAARALWPTDDPDAATARRFVAGSPRHAFQHMPVLVAAGSAIEAEIRNGSLGAKTLDELERVESQGYTLRDQAAMKLLKDDERMRWFVVQVNDGHALQSAARDAPSLRDLSAPILELRAAELGEALVGTRYLNVAIEVVKWLPRWAAQSYVDGLGRHLASGGSPRVGAMGFQIAHHVQSAYPHDKGANAGSAALEQIRAYLKSLDAELAAQWAADVGVECMSDAWRDKWEKFASSALGAKRGRFGRGGDK